MFVVGRLALSGAAAARSIAPSAVQRGTGC